MLKVPFSFLFIIHLIDGLPFGLQENTGPRRWAKFENPQGESVLVDLYPEIQPPSVGSIVDPDKVAFYLFTKEKVYTSSRVYIDEKDVLLKAGFNPKVKTKFIVHGFLNSLNSATIQTIKDNLLNADYEDCNVIAVDWSTYTLVYIEVNEKSKEVGLLIGRFMEFLIEAGTSPDDIHCIGHSLGAHACGFAGESIKSGKIARITGLDPALPGFDVTNPKGRLEATDAVFVDCIHTCGGFLGIDEPICSADYYPNGGKDQPGCHWFDFGSCSHGRSHEYFAESILQGHLFPALSCRSLEFSPDECVFKGALMGYPAVATYTGIFYTETNDQFPYAKNWTDIHFPKLH